MNLRLKLRLSVTAANVIESLRSGECSCLN